MPESLAPLQRHEVQAAAGGGHPGVCHPAPPDVSQQDPHLQVPAAVGAAPLDPGGQQRRLGHGKSPAGSSGPGAGADTERPRGIGRAGAGGCPRPLAPSGRTWRGPPGPPVGEGGDRLDCVSECRQKSSKDFFFSLFVILWMLIFAVLVLNFFVIFPSKATIIIIVVEFFFLSKKKKKNIPSFST